ncbi:hypothetical protein A2697_02680 [Candidatus Curtissbacteria bacterium RIFCSPHIGHO2_01_FULL_41_44]|uniref:GlcNAc-PI de-N-acetylase n=1 Tax=Candidatus Curtissbacteria bacterium RIFCSPLOWO2_01_FULL_42_50 TaxID=1797730 RepID=A0A1F5H8F0_9BACT|nr:MAG: hypothetical protein A2697_02680 [Candidatus Curtissbacteria bacterium RIFCSPHIGHO2_01_FULL_41_44]OGD92474.1 MAG: hypothetical protein A3C33_04770 [Candidatus Curtissbacteria bacterium RIFCSPHIGHO2_02_FULL_42_58]OGD96267.1 MAG: hypothetical protein A3E71_02265 [Candidatus Curtissbacteria bacterium RIFCSPHIGHO2_12_FULL_42_33]OGE00356.1 MAG: hypothetical protein A3B54_01445 [Candidatus Curtissbacteria bacterium RIFCSPLOWO2_01_FULL_42_50]OGE03815.1 MAG: hypothetical protein A3G16_05065 [Ca
MFELKKQRLLVLAPHPDDEVIGCGGLIKKIKDAGGKVYVLFLTVGDTRDFTKEGLSTGDQRLKEVEVVAKFLKFDDYSVEFKGNDYHLKLDTLGQKVLMDVIERNSKVSIEKVKPTVVTFPSPASYNQDHRIVAAAAHAALRPAPAGNKPGLKHFVSAVLSYKVPADMWTLENSSANNFFVPLDRTQVDAKIKALELYKSQLREAPSLRSSKIIESLVVLAGAMCGSDYAEAFGAWRVISDK